MAIKIIPPNFDAAARDSTGKFNTHQDSAFRSLHERLSQLEKTTQLQAVSSDKTTKVSPIPPRGTVKISTVPGNFQVSITNPEFQPSKGNPLRTPIYHKISYSPDASFRSGVVELPPGTQTHWSIGATQGAKYHFRISHSYDGKNWTLPTQTGSHTA